MVGGGGLSRGWMGKADTGDIGDLLWDGISDISRDERLKAQKEYYLAFTRMLRDSHGSSLPCGGASRIQGAEEYPCRGF